MANIFDSIVSKYEDDPFDAIVDRYAVEQPDTGPSPLDVALRPYDGRAAREAGMQPITDTLKRVSPLGALMAPTPQRIVEERTSPFTPQYTAALFARYNLASPEGRLTLESELTPEGHVYRSIASDYADAEAKGPLGQSDMRIESRTAWWTGQGAKPDAARLAAKREILSGVTDPLDQPSVWDTDKQRRRDRQAAGLDADKLESDDFMRAFSVTYLQVPQLAAGLTALTAETLRQITGSDDDESTMASLRDWSMGHHRKLSKTLELFGEETDSVNKAWAGAKAGDVGGLVDFIQYGIGYAAGQASQLVTGVTIAKAGLTGLAKTSGGRQAVETLAARLIAKKEAQLAASGVAASALRSRAVQLVAEDIAAVGFLSASAIGMEGGEIGGSLIEKAKSEGRELTGGEILQAWTWTLAAAAPEYLSDKLSLKLLGGEAGLTGSKLARTGKGVAVGLGVEGGTEFVQTYAEKFGVEGHATPGTFSEAIDAAALGAVGGGGYGLVGGLTTRPSKEDVLTTQMGITPQQLAAAIDTNFPPPGAATAQGAQLEPVAPTVAPTTPSVAPVAPTPVAPVVATPNPVEQVFDPNVSVDQQLQDVDAQISDPTLDPMSVIDQSIRSLQDNDLLDIPDVGKVRVRKSATDLRMEFEDGTLLDNNTIGRLLSDPSVYTVMERGGQVTEGGADVLQQRADLRDAEMAATGDEGQGAGLLGGVGVSGTTPFSPGVELGGDATRVIPGIGETRPVRTTGLADQAVIDVERVAREGWAATDAAGAAAAAEAARIMAERGAAEGTTAVITPTTAVIPPTTAVAPDTTAVITPTTAVITPTTAVTTAVIPPVAVGTSAAGNVVLTPPVGVESFTPEQVETIRTTFGGGVATGPADARVSVTLPKAVTLEDVNNAIQEQAAAESLLGAEAAQPQVEVGLPEVAVGDTQGPVIGGQAPVQAGPVELAPSPVPQVIASTFRGAIAGTDFARQQGLNADDIQLGTWQSLPEVSAGISRDAGKTLAAAIKALTGREVVFFSGPVSHQGIFVADATSTAKTLFVNANRTETNPLGTLGHEWLHSMKQSHRAIYDRLHAAVMGQNPDMRAMYRDYNAALPETARMTDAEIDFLLSDPTQAANLEEELMADLVGNRFKDVEFWNNFFADVAANEGKSRARLLADNILKMLRELKAVLKGEGFKADQFVKDIAAVEAVVKQAIREYMQADRTMAAQAVPMAPQVGEVKAAPRRTDFGMLDAKTRMVLSPNPLLTLPAAVPVESKLDDVNARLDAIAEAYPNVLTSPQMWFKFMADITGIRSAFMAPSRAIDWQRSPNDARNFVHRMTHGQRKSAAEGLATTKMIGQAFAEGDLDAGGLTKILVWGALSKQLTAAVQEAGFLRLFNNGLDQYVQKAASGAWTAEDTKRGLEWIDALFQAGQRGMPAQAKANANSLFTTTFPALARARFGEKPLLQHIVESLANGVPSRQIRRDFILNAGSSGIRNKVFSFALLAAGRGDVVVIDRWQARNFWTGPQTVDHPPVHYTLINAKGERKEKTASYIDSIYDGLPKGEATKGTTFGGISEYIDGPQGLAIYEAIERSLLATASEIYHGEGGVGRLHWESWLVINQQEVGHSSLEAILKNDPEYAPVVEGRKTVYTEGDIYVIEDQQETYYVPTGQGTFARYTAVEYAQLPQDREERASQATARLVSDGTSRPFTYGLNIQRDVPAGIPARGISVEVAPDPRDQAAVAAFNAMSEQERAAVTRETAEPIIRDLMLRLAIRDYSVEYTLGGFQGETQPSIDIHFGEGVSYDQIAEAAKILGTLWRQQAVITYDESDTSAGGGQFIKVMSDRKLSYAEIQDLFKQVYARFPAAAGFSARGGAVVFGNFTEGAVSSKEFSSGIRAALTDIEVETHTHFETAEFFFRSDWIEPVNLEGTRYESDSVTQEALSGRDMLRGRQGDFDTLQARSDKLFSRAVERRRVGQVRASPARSDAGRGGYYREGVGRDVRPVYGTERSREHSLSVVGVHYSKAPRQVLSSQLYGKGMAGEESARVFASKDKRIHNRTYFYANAGRGIHPESDVGAYPHTVQLDNIYDAEADPLFLDTTLPKGLTRDEHHNAFDSAVIDAGFDGFINKFGHDRAIVLLGWHSVKVRQEQPGEAVDVPLAPRSETNPYIAAHQAFVGDRSVPMGQMTGAGWKRMLSRTHPDMDVSALDDEKMYYRDAVASVAFKGLIPTKADIRLSPARSGAWYSSPLADAMAAAPDKIFGSASQVKVWLQANASKIGVKADEIQWSGINDWLDLQGKAKVTKADVAAYLDKGGVQVTETMLRDAEDIELDVRGSDRNGYYIVDARTGDEYPGDFASEDAAWDEVSRITRSGELEGAAKYDKYQLPGGTRYRELLLTLPTKAKVPAKQYRTAFQRFENGEPVAQGDEVAAARWRTQNPNADIREVRAETQPSRATVVEGVYRSPHFDESNILAHVRMNDRVDADGKRVLFIEELQGDWPQTFRQQQIAIGAAVDADFNGIVERMKNSGVLEVTCD